MILDIGSVALFSFVYEIQCGLRSIAALHVELDGGGPGVVLIPCGIVVYTTGRSMVYSLALLFVLMFLFSFLLAL